jgi:hypothetical protein
LRSVKVESDTYQVSAHRPVPDHTQVLRDMDDMVTEEFEEQEIMGSLYYMQKQRVLYPVQWTSFPDREDRTEEPFEHFPNAKGRL